jgi:hypothetical protein
MTGFIVIVFPFRNRVSSKEAFEGLELGEGKPSRPVLRGPGGRKAAWLLGNYSDVEFGCITLSDSLLMCVIETSSALGRRQFFNSACEKAGGKSLETQDHCALELFARELIHQFRNRSNLYGSRESGRVLSQKHLRELRHILAHLSVTAVRNSVARTSCPLRFLPETQNPLEGISGGSVRKPDLPRRYAAFFRRFTFAHLAR